MESPRNLQGTAMGLFWFVGGIGSFIGLALPYVFSSLGIWPDPTYMNCNRLDLFFYIFAASLLISSVIFGIIASRCDLSLDKIIIDQSPDILSSVTLTPELIEQD